MAGRNKGDPKGNLTLQLGWWICHFFTVESNQYRLVDSDFVSNIAFGGEGNNKLLVTGMKKVYIHGR